MNEVCVDKKYTSERTIEVAKYFSWLSFSLILVACIFLATFLVRSTLTSSVEEQESYLVLLAEDFNRQLFRRFTLPIILAEDSISLRNPDQYRLLNETVENMISGLQIKQVRILDDSGKIVYSTDEEEIQNEGATEEFAKNMYANETLYFFLEQSNLSYFDAFFKPELEDSSFLLQIAFPLSIDRDLISYFEDASILGILQLTVDVTEQYRHAIQLQRWIILIFVCSSLVLFLMLQYIARKAELVISERIEKNKELEMKLHQQEKLAGMGRMVASIAHEIRNPLGIIRSSSDLLKSRNKSVLDNSSQRILEAMGDEIDRLSNIVNDFLDYARPRQPSQGDVNLAFCIKKALTFLENKIHDEDIVLDLNIDESLIVKGEEDLLYRAFYNMISNSIQAMEGKENKILRILIYKKMTSKIIDIGDSGEGFKDEVLKKALDPFYTTKETGTGLGLPIAHSIIEAHRAQMRLYNNDMGGASIEVVF